MWASCSAGLSYSGMVPRDRFARPPRRVSICRSSPELPRHGAGGGTRTLGDSRSAAACLRCSATPAWFPRSRRRCVHRDQASNLDSSRSERDVLPIPPSLCTHATAGVAVQRRHPVCVVVVACTREHTRNAARERAHARPRGVVISISNLGIQGVKGQGPSSTDPLIGGDSRYGAKEKGPGVCQALGCQRG